MSTDPISDERLQALLDAFDFQVGLALGGRFAAQTQATALDRGFVKLSVRLRDYDWLGFIGGPDDVLALAVDGLNKLASRPHEDLGGWLARLPSRSQLANAKAALAEVEREIGAALKRGDLLRGAANDILGPLTRAQRELG